jgi:hypothetical protein
MLPHDIHHEMCRALEKVGGTPCEKLIADAQATQADILFEECGLFVEVKTLTEDRNKRKEVREKAGKILLESMRYENGPIPFGTVSAPLSDFPRPTAERLLLNMGERVRKNLRDASVQIKATAKRLNLPARGIVLMAVPSHFSTHPGVIATVASRILHPTKHFAIEALGILSVPIDGFEGPRQLSFTFSPRIHANVPAELVDRIATGWIAHLSEITGDNFTENEATFEDFESEFLVDEGDWPKRTELASRDRGEIFQHGSQKPPLS